MQRLKHDSTPTGRACCHERTAIESHARGPSPQPREGGGCPASSGQKRKLCDVAKKTTTSSPTLLSTPRPKPFLTTPGLGGGDERIPPANKDCWIGRLLDLPIEPWNSRHQVGLYGKTGRFEARKNGCCWAGPPFWSCRTLRQAPPGLGLARVLIRDWKMLAGPPLPAGLNLFP